MVITVDMEVSKKTIVKSAKFNIIPTVVRNTEMRLSISEKFQKTFHLGAFSQKCQ